MSEEGQIGEHSLQSEHTQETTGVPRTVSSQTYSSSTASTSGPHVLDEWFSKWFPENSGATPTPIVYLSAEWHHAHAAYDDLKAQIGRFYTEK